MFRSAWLTVAGLVISLSHAVAEDDGGWISLFDGKSLTGWTASEHTDSWKIQDGAIVTQGARSHLFYDGEVADHDFKNFELMAEVMTTPGSNSGIYVHTRFQDEGWPETGYELQVINSNPSGGSYVEHKMTGSIYAIRNTWQAPVADHQWFEYLIRVSGRTIQTLIDGKLICEYTEPEDPYRPPDKTGRLLGSGTIALQAHDPDSTVYFRSIKVRLLPDDAPTLGVPLGDRVLDDLITRFSNANLPLLDLGVVAASPAAAEQQASDARKYGMTLVSTTQVESLNRYQHSVLIINDREQGPNTVLLRAAKAAGAKVAFSSGGDTRISEARLRRRLEAIREVDLAWQDVWVPGKQ